MLIVTKIQYMTFNIKFKGKKKYKYSGKFFKTISPYPVYFIIDNYFSVTNDIDSYFKNLSYRYFYNNMTEKSTVSVESFEKDFHSGKEYAEVTNLEEIPEIMKNFINV